MREAETTVPIERTALCELIPHSGSMCLLDRVETWDNDVIVCSSNSHRLADNPLHSHGRLSTVCAFEYGAQAAALHGALLTGKSDGARRLFAALRDAQLFELRLDTIEQPLQIRATRLLVDGDNAVYSVTIQAGELMVAKARLSLMATRR